MGVEGDLFRRRRRLGVGVEGGLFRRRRRLRTYVGGDASTPPSTSVGTGVWFKFPGRRRFPEGGSRCPWGTGRRVGFDRRTPPDQICVYSDVDDYSGLRPLGATTFTPQTSTPLRLSVNTFRPVTVGAPSPPPPSGPRPYPVGTPRPLTWGTLPVRSPVGGPVGPRTVVGSSSGDSRSRLVGLT